MAFPVKVCSICSEEFELKPGKPGYANHCPSCSEEQEASGTAGKGTSELKASREQNGERRKAIRDLLYRKDS
jgi:hypothetical protein